MNILHRSICRALVVAAGMLAFAHLVLSPVSADIYLNGGIMSSVNPATGQNTGEPQEYDSFDTGNTDLFFNGVTGTPQLLANGANSFTITGHASNFTGFGLYFTTHNNLLNNFGLLPDLNVYIDGNGAFQHPVASTPVATLGQFSGNGPYSGLTSFNIDGRTVTVTGWDGTTLGLNVSTIPEPGVAGLIATGLFTWIVARRRRAM